MANNEYPLMPEQPELPEIPEIPPIPECPPSTGDGSMCSPA